MASLCICTLFDTKDRPLVAGIFLPDCGVLKIFPLLARGAQTSLYQVEMNKLYLSEIVQQAAMNNRTIVTTDFKRHLGYLDLPLEPAIQYNAYDLCWNAVVKIHDLDKLAPAVENILRRMAAARLHKWQLVLASAAPVYQSLENAGIMVGNMLHRPRWTQQTFSGRSKTTVFNAQGLDDSLEIMNPRGTETDYFVYFDWISADMNVAARLSGDEALIESFAQSDPYSAMRSMVGEELSRDECKLLLLKTVNSLQFESEVATSMFPKLGNWMRSVQTKIERDRCTETVLGRRFHLDKARNELALINGMLQGSVAHGMQIAVRRVWERYSTNLLLEVHDSMALSCPDYAVKGLIRGVSEIMVQPFAGMIDDWYFPTRVSIGKAYKKWKPIRIYRAGGVEKIDVS